MKKVFTTIVFSVLLYSVRACEICGCGLGNYYIGIMPHFNGKFIGLRYQFHHFKTRLNDDPTQFSNDFYQTAELWGGWNINPRLQLLAFVPFNFNHQESDEGIVKLNGMGDVAVLINYKLVDINSKNGEKNISHEFWIGGGLKLPTGKFELEEGNPDVAAIANTQRGSGSVDYMLNAMYNFRSGQLGVTTNASYKINSANKDNYRFGNKFSANSFVYYSLKAKNTFISPNAGLLYEHNEASQISSAKVELTGGSLFQAAGGIEFSFRKISVGCNIQLPVSQNFAEGQTESKLKGMAHITFAL